MNESARYLLCVSSKERVGAALRAHRERRGLSLAQVARKVHLGKTGVQAIETGRSGASLERLEEIASVVGAEVVVLVRDAEATPAAADELAAAVAGLDAERLALLLRIARALPDVEEVMARGATEGLELWARVARERRVSA